MARVHTTAFNETDCIGDCYEPINNSLDNLDTAVQSVSSSLGGFKNKLINGNFDIWQRGNTFNAVAVNGYTADRWAISYDNGGTRNITRQAFTRGQTDVPNNPFYFLSVQQTIAGTSAPQKFNALVQRMEDSRLLSGKKVVLTFWAKASTPFNSVISLQQWFGTGGSPSPQVVHNSPEFQITTTWQKFTINFELSSVSGKVLGTNPDTDFLQVAFGLPLNSTFTFDVAQVQLEEGSFATPFEQRPIGTELALCQRYYEKSYPVDVAPGAVNDYRGSTYEQQAVYTANTFAGALLKVTFKQTKRTSAPTITVYNPNNGTANQLSIWSNGATWDRNVAISTPEVADHSRALIWPIAGTTVNSGYICIAHWVVDAEL